MMTGGPDGFRQHGEDHHPDHFMNGGAGGQYFFAEKKYFLPETGQWFSSTKYLSRALKKQGITNEQYFLKNGQKYLFEKWDALNNDPVLGNARATAECLECGKPTPFTENRWQYPAFCGFSCSTTWYAKNTDRVAKSRSTIDMRKESDPDFMLLPNQTQYWLNRGHTEDEAKELVAERQRTNTLEKFVERHGEEDGTKKYAERQEKWLNSLKKSGMHSGVSGISTKLFTDIAQHVDGIKFGVNEVVVRLKETSVKVDCIHRPSKRIIEFYGDYWHGNPEIYSEDHIIQKKMKAKEKWEKDQKRNQHLVDSGYDVLIVWENDYRKNPEFTVGRCVGFLNAK
jgi:G:T-mismatch repair DNA endonuclease (very short patch repair protein)/endogenous inhibitor of DNA gyrase (YacG/DUF329 family)